MYNRSFLMKCQACGLLYVSPRLTRESFALHFNKNYMEPLEALRWEQSRHLIYQQVLQIINAYRKTQVFEIGCAYGTFLSMCKDSGIEVSGCDISLNACRDASARLKEEILNGYFEDIQSLVAPQECIVSIDTFYYCPDPENHLKLIYDTLRPGGIFVLRVRNGMYIELKTRLGLRSFPIEHIYFYTPRTLSKLLGKAGFSTWKCIPGVCKQILSPIDSLFRSLSLLTMPIVGNKWALTKDFCMVAVKG